MDSFLRNHLLYLLCALLGTVAAEALAAVDAISNWWHAVVCALLSLLPKARVRFRVHRPAAGYCPAVLVTGTSSGIGHDIAVALAARGYTVFAGVRSWEDGARVESDFVAAANGPVRGSPRPRAQEQQQQQQQQQRQRRRRTAHRPAAPGSGTPGTIVPVILDVSSSESIDQAYEHVAKELRARRIPLVGVVNNAGVTASGPMDMSAPAFVDHCMAVNFHGPVRVTQRFMPLLRASGGGGRVVNISSIMAWLVGPGFGVYCASKAALSAASRAWHYELAGAGISVSVLEPGITRTPLWAKVDAQLELHHARLNGIRPEKRPRGLAAMPGDEAIASAPPRSDSPPPDAAAATTTDDDHAMYTPMIRRIRHSNELAPVLGLSTRHAVDAAVHALSSSYPKAIYRVGWDARLMSLATWAASDEVVEWLCRATGIVSED
ncbi:hypothetical protein H4R18_003506 [Coemansia javaensis]|uniref:NAD(P)-binding protein n=1 Tax=Coemansia javaensis TaxID=2761396 RepID=A0A9W8H7N2_9FUNG|nr:hypothetical protein H4R18_003506 [Coemansia javaensis]